jgi:hypothetical protein
MAQIRPVTSESLEAQIRDLLPSQSGFSEDLQATNVITPIIDLTSVAEGDVLGTNLQTAIAFGSQTAFTANNNTVALANSPGFWRIFGFSYGWFASPTGFSTNSFTMTDGLSTKTVWAQNIYGNASNPGTNGSEFDFVVFLAAGESISAVSSSVSFLMQGSYRQIADVNGNLVNPSGFKAQ